MTDFSQQHLAFQAERERRRLLYGHVKPVICELCARGKHQACVRPCVCTEDHKR